MQGAGEREPASAQGWRAALLGAALVVLAYLALVLVRDTTHADELLSDEPEWIAISVLHLEQLATGEPIGAELRADDDPGANPWMRGVQRTTFGYMNPCLPKLVWGGALWLAGHRSASPLVFQSFQGGDARVGERARADLLPALPTARRVVLAFAALATAGLFLVGRRALPGVGGWVCGATAAGLWLSSPMVHRTAAYLRTDHFMLAFVLGAFLLLLRRGAALARRGPDARAWWRHALLLGLLVGLALSSKLSGSQAAIAILLWALLTGLRGCRARGAAGFLGPLPAVLLAGAVAAAVFVALQPVTWGGPLEGARAMLARWDRHTAFIQESWGPGTRAEVVATTGERLDLFARVLFGRYDPVGALLGPFVGGAVQLSGAVVLGLWARRGDGPALAAFLAVLLGVTALTLPIEWERLFLPAFAAVCLLEGAAAAGLVLALGRLERGRSRARSMESPPGA